MENIENTQATQINYTNPIRTGNHSFDEGVRVGFEIGVNQALRDQKINDLKYQFTQEELQFLKSTFSGILTRLHDYQERVNLKIAELFEKCNPEDPNTSGAFVVMNGLRDDLREKKAVTKRLASIQKKIKSSLRRG